MKKIILFLIFVLIYLSINAQVPSWEWARSGVCALPYGGGDVEGIASDNMGNVYETGIFGDSISFGSYSLIGIHNGGNAFLVKYNSLGNVIWAKNANDSTIASPYGGITTDPLGNIYVAGYFQSKVTFGSFVLIDDSATTDDIFIAKYDANGNVIWARSIGASGNDRAYGINADVFGNIYITGWFNSSSLTFGSHIISRVGNSYNIFIAKYDSLGNAIWAKSAGGNGIDGDSGSGITSDLYGNVYITGTFYSNIAYFDQDSLINSGSQDFYLARYDSAGNVIWAKNAIGISQDQGNSVTTDAHGNIYATGWSSSPTIVFGSDTLINPNGNSMTVFIVKYDSIGNVIWAKNSSGIGMGFTIIADASGNAYVTGCVYTHSITFDTVSMNYPSLNNDQMFLVKYDSSGHAIYGFAFQSGGDDYNGVALGQNNSLYVGGDFYFINPFILGDDTLILTGGQFSENPFIAKLGFQIIENMAEIKLNQTISIYPNPTSGTLTLSYSLPQSGISNYELGIMDVLGRTVYTQAITNPNQTTINVSQLSNGVYFYQLTNNKETYRGKFVKE